MPRIGRAVHAFRILAPAAAAALLILALAPETLAWGTDSGAMAERIAALIRLEPGSTIAEIGAGHGYMAVRMAEKVGPAGQVYATEIDSDELAEIRRRATDAGLGNVIVVKASDKATGLPAGCCAGIYMTGVYHHFEDPLAMDRSLFAALKPGGRLFVADFYPTWLFSLWTTPAMRRNFGGHGVPEPLLEDQLESVGFTLVERIDGYPHSWLLRNYSLVMERPAAASHGGH